MKIVDIKEVPKKIGEAEIVVQPRKSGNSWQLLPLAYRKDKTIVLDPENNGKFFSVMNGRQFLYSANDGAQRKLFFGGMDESPFLVELNYQMIEHLIGGEEAFFDALKPLDVRKWEQRFHHKAKRQGDFFAVSPGVKSNWQEFILNHLGNSSITIKVVKEVPLRDTRHKFTGVIGTISSLIMGEGKIEAPDHEPLILEEPHLIEQAVGFVTPKDAD